MKVGGWIVGKPVSQPEAQAEGCIDGGRRTKAAMKVVAQVRWHSRSAIANANRQLSCWHRRKVRQPMKVGGRIAGTAGGRNGRLNCEEIIKGAPET